MTSVFLRSLTTTGAKSTPRPVDRLADRELEVLELIGRGNTTRQIADKLQLGSATVDTYRARILSISRGHRIFGLHAEATT